MDALSSATKCALGGAARCGEMGGLKSEGRGASDVTGEGAGEGEGKSECRIEGEGKSCSLYWLCGWGWGCERACGDWGWGKSWVLPNWPCML